MRLETINQTVCSNLPEKLETNLNDDIQSSTNNKTQQVAFEIIKKIEKANSDPTGTVPDITANDETASNASDNTDSVVWQGHVEFSHDPDAADAPDGNVPVEHD